MSQLKSLIPARFRPIGYLVDLVQRRTGKQVNSGPFRGMRYVEDSHGSCYIPKLLGIYERELHGAVEQLISWAPDLIIDAGAAEGYYAVGLARRLPETRVVAFEMDDRGRTLLRQMSVENGVADRVECRGKCEAEAVEARVSSAQRPLVVCDTEGYERQLLDPQAAPSLARSAILVELHDFIFEGTHELLVERFSETHGIERIWQEERSPSEFPYANWVTRMLPQFYRDFPLSEWRPVQMSWLVLRPRASA